MLQTTYLTTDELKSFTPISNSVDISQLENWIPVAETLHIIPILGTALDTALKTELEALGTLTGDNATLLTHIQNASAWYCFFEASTFLRTKAMNKGITQQFSENSQVAPLDDFKAYKQSILDIAMHYRNYLVDFLEANKTTYPLYRSEFCCDGDYDDCDNDCQGRAKDNSSGVYLG